MKRKSIIDEDGEVRELTLAEMRRFRPAHEVVPDIVAAYRRSRGRPAGRTKEVINLSLDIDVIAAMRKSGPGWQTRANAVLRKNLKLPAHHETAH